MLLTIGFAAAMLSASSQIIITGVMYDPKGADSAVPGPLATPTTLPDGVTPYLHKGGYEYAQFMATENINFATTPFSVVFARNPGATTTTIENGWAAGGDRTYKFNLTSGEVTKGEFFYVGGPEKILGGYVTIDGVTYQSADISAAKWIRTIVHSTTPGDGFGNATTALLPNSGNPGGVAVFVGTTIDGTTVPLDAVFISSANPITSVSSVYNSANQWGYLVPNSDFYDTTDMFFGKGANTKTLRFANGTGSAADNGAFIKLGGDYNTTTNTWNTPRSSNNIALFPASTVAASTLYSLSDIETGNTTLPVALTTFTAKANKTGSVNVSWTTASEKNNSHFEVTRSADGVSFNKLAEVAGSGNTNTAQHYNYTDAKPASGNNYYRLKQVDHDGKSAYSQIVAVNTGFGIAKLTVAASANRNSVKVSYEAVTNGHAIIAIYNSSGVKLASSTQSVNAGANQITVPVALGNSVHVVKVSQSGMTSSVKF